MSADTVKHQPATPRVIPEAAARTGLEMARKLFAKRGNHSEAHIAEEELAVMLAAAFHLGTTHRDDAYPKLVEALRILRACTHSDGTPAFNAATSQFKPVDNPADARTVLGGVDALLRELGETS